MNGRASPQDLPSALPNNWPHPTPHDLEQNPNRHVRVGGRQSYYFHSNGIKTSLYTMRNFLPKFLSSELHPSKKVANFYFFVVACFQCIPQISNTEGLPTTLLPLIILLAVEAVFQIWEDYHRQKYDAVTNNHIASRYDYYSRRFVDVRWCDIQVGDMVQIKCRSVVPADIVLFAVAEKSDPPVGICYIDTQTLDGETKLTIRRALSLTFAMMQDIAMLDFLKGEIHMEHPNKLIYEFNGLVDLGKVGNQKIEPENILLRGTTLRSTDWAIGVVVNTGPDTKVMMARNAPRPKITSIEQKTSIQIKRIIVLLVIVSVAGAAGAGVFNEEYKVGSSWYLKFIPDAGSFFFANIGYFFLLHGSFVPISLYVSIAIARYFQTYFMQKDVEMYHARSDLPMTVRNMRLNEDLGQVTHIFTDKTGTLTRNCLEFRKASINGICYGQGISEISRQIWQLQGKEVPENILADEERAQQNGVPHVVFYCPKYDEEMKNMSGAQRAKIQEFFRALSICHQVVCERMNGATQFSAPNPDDECLVNAAAYFGFRFRDRRNQFIVIEHRDRRGGQEEVEVLVTIPFTTARRRMSVIVKEEDGSFKIYCKGADNVILPRLRSDQMPLIEASCADLRRLSVEGFRCLLVCVGTINPTRFREWHQQYEAAIGDFQQQQLHKAGKDNFIQQLEDLIEKDLSLLGVTGIEDKLQFGASNCVRELTSAGVHIWMLTGDRDESAQTVAVACNLLLPKAYMHRIPLNRSTCSTTDQLVQVLEKEVSEFDKELQEVGVLTCRPRAALIDGSTLALALSTDNPYVNELLVLCLQRCKVVIATRLTSADKADLVRFVRLFIPDVKTMAIGDGNNDVSMILEADIGVGLSGEEGFEAANSADYVIAQFRYLSPLILKHGHWNYVRMANLVCFTFYKNILMSASLFWFNFQCAYTGQKLFTEGTIQMYNIFYTTMPILAYAAYDTHVMPSSIYRYPQLFRCCLTNEFFNDWVFWGWIFHAIAESLILSIIPLYLVNELDTFLEAGCLCMTGCVIVVSAKLCIIQSKWYWQSILLILVQLGLLVATFYTVGAFAWFDFGFYKLFEHLCFNYSAWLTLLLQLTAIIGKDIYLCVLDRSFNFNPIHIAQEADAGMGKFTKQEVVPILTPEDAVPSMAGTEWDAKALGGRNSNATPASKTSASVSPSPFGASRQKVSIVSRTLALSRQQAAASTTPDNAVSPLPSPILSPSGSGVRRPMHVQKRILLDDSSSPSAGRLPESP